MFTFLLVVHAIIAASLVTVILMQRSEGGGLGMGSGPSGLMTARGAADFLTRATSVLATLFVLMALALAAYASIRNGGGEIDTSLAKQGAPGPINAPLPAAPTAAIPMMGGPLPSTPAAPSPLATAPAAADTAHAPAPQAKPSAHAPSLSSIKTIDTHAAPEKVGINGVSTRGAAPDTTDAKVGTGVKTPSAPKPETKAATDTSATSAPTPANTGNQAQ